jgi:NADH-quinone oxidoreductase subunit N
MAILLPTAVMVWGMLLLLLDLVVPRPKVIGVLALLGLVGIAAAGAFLWDVDRSAFKDMVRQDRYSLYVNWILLGGTALTILISLDYLPRMGIERGEYYPLLLFATGGMMLLAQATDLITLFLGVELLSISLYILTGFAYPRLASGEAAMKYLLLGAFAAGFLVYGIALVYGVTGQTSFMAIGTAVKAGAVTSQPLLRVGLGLLLVALGFKVAVVPFHTWTPDVYEGAPTPITAYMSVATKAAAFAALFRLVVTAFPIPALIDDWRTVLAVMAVLTMIVGNVVAISQTSLKRMLAYSSIAHAGYILLGVLAGNSRGAASILLYLAAYTLTNIGAFGVAAAVEEATPELASPKAGAAERSVELQDLAGLGARQPLVAAAMTIFMLSLAGVPPTAGFVGKFAVFQAAWEQNFKWLAIIAVLTSVISAFFYLRVIVTMYMRDPARDTRQTLSRPLAAGLAVTAAVTLAMIFLLAFLPGVSEQMLALR